MSVDPYVVPLLDDYYNSMCKNDTLEWIRVGQNDRVTMDIYHFSKSVKRMKNSKTVAEIIKQQFKSGVLADEFPIVIQGILEDGGKKKDSKTEGLWVDRAISGAAPIPMFDEKNIGIKTVKYKYLIVPMTETIWSNLTMEFENKTLTRAKYTEMMKTKDEWRLLETWIYKYQIIEPRKKLADIKELVDKMIDRMYDWLFG